MSKIEPSDGEIYQQVSARAIPQEKAEEIMDKMNAAIINADPVSKIEAGCFSELLYRVEEAVTKTHGYNNYYAFEYLSVCDFIEHHFSAKMEGKS